MRIPPAERLLAMVGYVPFLWWLPIMARRDSMFCQFHGRQAGVLWGLWALVAVGCFVGLFFTPAEYTIWVFGAFAVVTGVYLLMSVVGFVKAGIRERYRMPVVADVALMLRL